MPFGGRHPKPALYRWFIFRLLLTGRAVRTSSSLERRHEMSSCEEYAQARKLGWRFVNLDVQARTCVFCGVEVERADPDQGNDVGVGGWIKGEVFACDPCMVRRVGSEQPAR